MLVMQTIRQPLANVYMCGELVMYVKYHPIELVVPKRNLR